MAVSLHDQQRLIGQFPIFRDKIFQRYHSLLPADAPPPNLADRDPVVLCVGTIGGRKAQPNLAEAFARIANRRKVYAGQYAALLDPNILSGKEKTESAFRKKAGDAEPWKRI